MVNESILTLGRTSSHETEPMTENGSNDHHILYSPKQLSKTFLWSNWKNVLTRLREHQLATKHRNQDSLISMHADEHGHTVISNSVKIISRNVSKQTRKSIEAGWLSKISSNNTMA